MEEFTDSCDSLTIFAERSFGLDCNFRKPLKRYWQMMATSTSVSREVPLELLRTFEHSQKGK